MATRPPATGEPGKPVPEEALAEFPKLHRDLANHNHGFDVRSTNEKVAARKADIGGSADVDEKLLDQDESDEWLHEPDQEGSPMEFDDTCDDEVDDEDIPELTEEILAKMFSNMLAHGLEV